MTNLQDKKGKIRKLVGLILVTFIPDVNGKQKLMAVLQKRGPWDFEVMKPEILPGCYQVTFNGELKEKETFLSAFFRESGEELGIKFTDKLKTNKTLRELNHLKKENKEVIIFGALVSPEQLSLIRLSISTGGFALIDSNEIKKIIEVNPEIRENGVQKDRIVMFPDEIIAIKKAFEIFEKQ